jgi:hypothetical protein
MSALPRTPPGKSPPGSTKAATATSRCWFAARRMRIRWCGLTERIHTWRLRTARLCNLKPAGFRHVGARDRAFQRLQGDRGNQCQWRFRPHGLVGRSSRRSVCGPVRRREAPLFGNSSRPVQNARGQTRGRRWPLRLPSSPNCPFRKPEGRGKSGTDKRPRRDPRIPKYSLGE